MPRKRLPRLRLHALHLRRRAEHGPAELHAALDDARAVVADDPAQRVRRERACGLRRGVEQRDLVEAQPDLGVGRRGELVERPEALDV